MKRAPRIDAHRLDLGGFEAWLRAQLTSPALAAVLVVVLQIVRALFAQNSQLRVRLLARKVKPPSERLDAVEHQISFAFALPTNDVKPAECPARKRVSNDDDKDASSRRSPRARQPMPNHIATIVIPNNVPANARECKACGVEMKLVGHRSSSIIEMTAAQFAVHERRDETLACPKCDAMCCAAAPPSLLDGGLLGPTLVTESLANKILDAMPVERQARNYQRQGVPVAASTLGRSISSALELMVPVADCILQRVKESTHVQLDSSGLRVLDPRAMTGTHRDTLWVLVGDSRWIAFAALQSGDSDSIEALMRGADADCYQCDGTSTTNFLEKKWKRCRPGCHAHARRKLVEAVRCGDLRAMEPLRMYGRLFKVERDATAHRLDPTARQQLRQARSVPILDEIRDWVVSIAPGVEPKSPLGQAVTYLQRQWMRLCLFVIDGEIELTNNRSERELRAWVLGQHAWLFVGDQVNAQRWAAGFSLVHTALAHGLNPRKYLHALVAKLLGGHSHTRLTELLPDAMVKANPELADPLRARRDAAAATASRGEQAA